MELQGELNRLAGTSGLGPAAAACLWAGVAVGTFEVVGALNYKAGTVGLELQGVCNALAGTVGLAPPGALAVIP